MLETMFLATQPIVAEALITWTVETYYVAMALFHFVLVLAAFKILQIDAENNAIVSGLVVGVAAGAAGYFLKDQGLIGVLVVSAALFGTALMTTAGDALKSLVLTGICIMAYAILGHIIVPRTPLNATMIGGFTKAIMVGLDEEAVAGEDDLYEHTTKDTESSLSE